MPVTLQCEMCLLVGRHGYLGTPVGILVPRRSLEFGERGRGALGLRLWDLAVDLAVSWGAEFELSIGVISTFCVQYRRDFMNIHVYIHTYT